MKITSYPHDNADISVASNFNANGMLGLDRPTLVGLPERLDDLTVIGASKIEWARAYLADYYSTLFDNESLVTVLGSPAFVECLVTAREAIGTGAFLVAVECSENSSTDDEAWKLIASCLRSSPDVFIFEHFGEGSLLSPALLAKLALHGGRLAGGIVASDSESLFAKIRPTLNVTADNTNYILGPSNSGASVFFDGRNVTKEFLEWRQPQN
jgi:hypothetical protein